MTSTMFPARFASSTTPFIRLSNWPRNWVPATMAVIIQQIDFQIQQFRRHIAFCDADGKAFGDRGLADARLT